VQQAARQAAQPVAQPIAAIQLQCSVKEKVAAKAQHQWVKPVELRSKVKALAPIRPEEPTVPDNKAPTIYYSKFLMILA
jgi:hypothetical protein